MSAFVKRTPAIGVLRGESRCGCNCGMFSICRVKSGEALIKNQRPKAFGVAADGDAGLRLRRNFSAARSDAVGARAIPLWQAAARCAAENMDANQPEFSKALIPFDQTAPA